MKMNRLSLVVFLISVFLVSWVFADESPEVPTLPPDSSDHGHGQGEISADEKYLFPVIPPEFALYGGYRFVSDSGSPTADEYEFLNSSMLLGGEARYFSFPHRFHLNLDFNNSKNYYGDMSYAYEDMFVFRGISRSLYHNLDNYRLFDVKEGNSSYEIDDKDSYKKYGVRAGINNFFMRFKTHDFPFHVYIDGGLIERHGSQQQISFLKGSSRASSGIRTALPRDIDFSTKTITVGANSHLGPVEIDISHGEKRFSVAGESVMYGEYLGLSSGRDEGIYPHNLIPETRSSSNTIKLHTSFTGGIVASATVSKIERENRDSGAKADLLIGAMDLTYTASPRLAFFLKYRHRDNDADNPDTVKITNRTTSNVWSYPVKNSISSVSNAVTGIVRYRPVTGVVLKGEVTYEDIHRNHTEVWGDAFPDFPYKFPEATTRNITVLSADLRLIKSLNLKLKYTHKDINNPAYNIEPDTSDEGKVSVSWMPHPRISTLLSCSTAKEKREDIKGVSTEADDREVRSQRLYGSATFMIQNDLSLTASYAFMSNRTEQDIAIGSITDTMVPNRILSRTLGLDLNYAPKNNFSIGVGVNHTLSSGKFYPSDPALFGTTSPESVGDFSALRTKETVLYGTGEYRFRHGYSLGLHYKYTRLEDEISNIYDDISDGRSHIVFMTVAKRW